MSETAVEKGRGEIEDLLPWYANGRLSVEDRRRVEAALAADGELARRLELVREEMAETIAANEALTPRGAQALDALMSRIAAEPPTAKARIAAAKRGLFERIGEALGALAPRRLALAAAAAVVVIAVQAVVVGGLAVRGGGGFETASQGGAVVAGPSVLVAFVADARIEDVAAFLKRHGVERAEGPKATGLFRLQLGAGADAKAVAARMSGESAVVSFVQAAP